MTIEFSGPIWFWRGPAPWYFVTVPFSDSAEIKEVSAAVTYGWGMIPVEVVIGTSRYRTALWPKDGSYVVPLKAIVRRTERLDEGQIVTVRLEI